MPAPLDPATLPDTLTALRALLLQREEEHAAELTAARDGLKDQAFQIEQLKARLATLLRQKFGPSSEKMKAAVEQLQLMLGDLEADLAAATPPEPAAPDPDAPIPDPEACPGGVNPNANPCPRTCRATWWNIPPPAPAPNAAAPCVPWART